MAKKKEKTEAVNQRYIIVSQTTRAYLQDSVNLMIDKGYMPVGGVGAIEHKDGVEFFQAMIRPAEITF